MATWHGPPPFFTPGNTYIAPKPLKKKKPYQKKYVTDSDKTCPFTVGQIIFNKKRPSIRRLIIEEPKLLRVKIYGHSLLYWEFQILNLRKSANGGKKSTLKVSSKKLKDFDVFSDLEVTP